MRVLVAYGSKMGGTEGLARALAEGLSRAGHTVDVRSAETVDGLAAWDAVILGGALYAFRWHREARRFARRHADELSQIPVWFFSSGPLDDSASKGNIPPTRQVRRLATQVNARGHLTFGGRLDPHAKGWIAQAMVKKGLARDFRDMEAVRAWGRAIASELSQLPPVEVRTRRELPTQGLRRLTGALTSFTGLTAIAGGLSLMLRPQGLPGMDPSTMLRHTPFPDFFAPGLLLFGVVGLVNLVAGWMVIGHRRGNEIVAVVGGAALAVWMASELVMLRGVHWLQVVYVVIALATLASALALWLRRSRLREASSGPRGPHLRWRSV